MNLCYGVILMPLIVGIVLVLVLVLVGKVLVLVLVLVGKVLVLVLVLEASVLETSLSRLISSPFHIPVRDRVVPCSRSDTCHFGHD